MEIERCVGAAGTNDGHPGCGLLIRTTCLLVGLGIPACGGSAPTPGSADNAGEVIRRDTTIVHEPCAIDAKSAVKTDVNRDGTPDLIAVTEAGKVVCQWLDLNFDRVVDVWVYYASDGSVRRRETDFDRDGRIDEVSTWSAGKVVLRERATTLAGRLDTWLYFKAGVLERGERDSNGDGVVDQWWEYPDPSHPDCAMVHSDTDGDGRPDPGSTVDICGADGSPLKRTPPPDLPDDALELDTPLTETSEEQPQATSPEAASAAPPSSEGGPNNEKPPVQEKAAP